MPRIHFLEVKQSESLSRIKGDYGIDRQDIAAVCRVHPRTLFDWQRDKYQMSHTALLNLKKRYRFKLPKVKILSDTWHIQRAARLGALRRNELYGPPGTQESRRKGGIVSALKFHNNPEFAKRLGFKLRKRVVCPAKSGLLAEFIGILLGDGSINRSQISIYNNNKTDRDYAHLIKRMIRDLFKIDATISVRDKNTIIVTASGKNLIHFLVACGMKEGNKMLNGADVPKWILRNKEFTRHCLRGLIDTDGGIYFHNHITKGIRYRHMGLCFTSHSKLILNSAYKMFLRFNLNCRISGGRHVYIYDRKEVDKYMQMIGSNNTKHIKRFRSYNNLKV